MALQEDVIELRKKVKDKRERDKLFLEQKKLREELDEGTLKGLARKGIRKLWKKF